MSLGYVITGITTTIGIMFLSAALTDGTSVVHMKEEFSGSNTIGPIGYPYDIGVFHDSKRNQWTDGPTYAAEKGSTTRSHIVELFGCEEHQQRGQLLKACVFMALVIAVIAAFLALAGAKYGGRCMGIISLVLQIFLFVFFLIGTAAAASLYNEEFDCDYFPSSVAALGYTKTALKLKDYFDLSYALPFLVVGIVVAIVNIIVLIATGTLSTPPPSDAVAENKPDEE